MSWPYRIHVGVQMWLRESVRQWRRVMNYITWQFNGLPIERSSNRMSSAIFAEKSKRSLLFCMVFT